MNKDLLDAQESLSFWKSIIVPLECITYMISPKPCFQLQEFNTQWYTTRRHEKKIANARAPSHVDQFPPLEEVVVDDQAPANPPPMTEAQMKAILTQMDQSITTQDQAATVQAQAMAAQANREVAPRVHQ